MTHSRRPPPSYLRQASNTRRWVRAVAERQGVSPRALAQSLRTPGRLTIEVAAILRDYCHYVAVQLVRDGAAAPTGQDLLDRTIARYHERYSAIRAERDRAAQAATIATLKAMQQKQKQTP